MSGQNPNVFYEVGYAHARGKRVILITQKLEDIPFDLKVHQHLGYDANDIPKLQTELTSKLKTALENASRDVQQAKEQLDLAIFDVRVPEESERAENQEPVQFARQTNSKSFNIQCIVRNDSHNGQTIYSSNIEIMTRKRSSLAPARLKNSIRPDDGCVPLNSFSNTVFAQKDDPDQIYPLISTNTGVLQPGGFGAFSFLMMFGSDESSAEEELVMRIQSNQRMHDFRFVIKIKMVAAPNGHSEAPTRS